MTSLLKLSDQLAGIRALKELHPRLRNTIKPSLDNVLALVVDLQLAFLQSLFERLQRLWKLRDELDDNESSDFELHCYNVEPILDAYVGQRSVVS